jgi:hypothetical protein
MSHTHIQHTDGQWLRYEQWLCGALIMKKTWFFLQNLGTVYGGDAIEQMKVVDHMNLVQSLGVRELFYSYHPPMGFLLTKLLKLATGLSTLISAQILSFACSVAAFLILRATLRQLGLLGKPAAVAFLYIAASMPVQWSLARAVTLDVFIVCFASFLLYFSVRLFADVRREEPQGLDPLSMKLAVVGILAAALLTKFAVAMGRGNMLRRCVSAASLSLCAVLLVSPYYVNRYVIPEGTLFPSNLEWLQHGQETVARQARDKDVPGFIMSVMFSDDKAYAAAEGQPAAVRFPKMSWTWMHFWSGDPHVFFLDMTWYARGAALLAFAGALVWLARCRKSATLWLRFGSVLAAYAVLQLSGMATYLWKYPAVDWPTNNGLYIATAGWVIAYFLCTFSGHIKRIGGNPALFTLLMLCIFSRDLLDFTL